LQLRPTLSRGLWTGLAYAASLFGLELFGLVVFFHLAGMGRPAALLGLLVRPMAPLFVQYCLFGLALGSLLALPVAALESRLPRRLRGAGLNLGALALAVTALAYLWNSRMLVPPSVHAVAAGGTLLALLVFRVLLWPLAWLVRRVLPDGTRRLRRRWIALAGGMAGLVVAVFALAPAPSPMPAPTAGSGPNVVILVVDTLRRDHVSAYGYGRKTTPALDAIAAEGTLYEHAYTPAPWTLPAHASLLTGLYPSAHETDFGHIRLPAERQTLAELLHAHGWSTGAFTANPWLSPVSGLDQGFDVYDFLGIQITVNSTFFLNGFKHAALEDMGGEELTDRLIAWTGEQAAARRPFFAFANYMEVHEPYGMVPEPYRSRWLSRSVARAMPSEWAWETPLYYCAGCQTDGDARFGRRLRELGGVECRSGRWQVTGGRLQDVVDLYDGGASYVDHQIGRIVTALREAGLLEQTLLVVTSDHGESLGELGQLGHNVWLHDSLLAVPLLVRYPARFPAGLRVAAPVSLVDMVPSVAAVAGLEPPLLEAAASLVPGDLSPAKPRDVLAEYLPLPADVLRRWSGAYHCDMSPAGHARASLQRGSVKLVWNAGAAPDELYDLVADPTEEHNVIDARRDEARNLGQELLVRLARLRPQRSSAEGAELDPLTKATLESLGYAQ
jgi:arylsulfatase A-like enzyme